MIMSFWAPLVKKVGIAGIFMIVVGIISDLLGFTGERDLYDIAKTFIMSHKFFFLGVFAGLVVASVTKNWTIGLIAAIAAIFVLYTVVGS